MTYDICFYSNISNRVSFCQSLGYAVDVIKESLAEATSMKGKHQLFIMRRENGTVKHVFAIYNYVYGDSSDSFGICLVFRDYFPNDIKYLFEYCSKVVSEIIEEGKLLFFDKFGGVCANRKEISQQQATVKRHLDRFENGFDDKKLRLAKLASLPSNYYNKSKTETIVHQLSDNSWTMKDSFNYYNNVIITEEIEDENINSMRNLILNLNETIEKLNQQITILQSQQKKQENTDKRESQEKNQINSSNDEMKKNVKEVQTKKSNTWIIVVLLSLVIVGVLMLYLRGRNELIIAQKQVGILEDKVRVADYLFEQASSTIKNVTNDTVYGDWVSTNHRHGSVSFQDYNFDVSEGDELSFGYFVSSEKTYDRLIVTLSFIDNDSVIENNLITVSGEEISHFTYHFDRSGHYSVRVKYTKDSSINKYKDLAGINNFVILRNHKVEFDSIDSIINQWLHHNELTVEERDDAVQPLIIRP